MIEGSPMAQSTGYYVVGDYTLGRQLGAGSFSTVWHALHRAHGTEVAIKEIDTARLNPKLQESLKSEIFILQRINHPNIVRFHEMIEAPGKIYIVLEYCKGGDLSKYIQQHRGRITEAVVKHFMQQLAEGLKVLRENNLIHRDLKPQNLLLLTSGDSSILKIGDFGFARSLDARDLAETLCGSPLYMAPEIMQLQKYDAKADLWSVGTILFQLVTGKPPFTGKNQIQLLQNIMRSTELQFPPETMDLSPHCIDLCRKLLRRNPVERLTFEEFFNHPYLSRRQLDESFRCTNQNLQEDWLQFPLDEVSSGPDGNPSFDRRSTTKSMYGFPIDSKPDPRDLANRTGFSKYSSGHHKTEITESNLGTRKLLEGNTEESLRTTYLGLLDNHPKVMASLDSIEKEYVIVMGPLLSSSHASKPSTCSSKIGSPPLYFGNMNSIPSAPVPTIEGATGGVNYIESLATQLPPPGISQGSMYIADTLERPPTDYTTRISSLQHYAAAITELVNDKIVGGKLLEAFSVQLVILAIWKQALHICHTHAASAIEGSPSQETTRSGEVSKDPDSPYIQESLDISKMGPLDICSKIERAFLHEVGRAEELAKVIEPGNEEMPDAMELVYQSALVLGKYGAVDEYMGDIGSAAVCYSKAVCLLLFLLVEAPCLILNPPFSLTNSDQYRIKKFIDVLNNRKSISRSQRMAIISG